MSSRFSRRNIAALLLYLVSAIAISFGVFYLVSPTILPYHETYLEMRHADLSTRVAGLLLNAMRIVGLLLISLGAAMAAVVAIPFRRGEIWSWWVLLGGWGSVLVPLFFITLRVGFQSPWWLVLFMGFCVATALALTCERTP